MAVRYLIALYLKNFLFTLFALVIFFVGLDFLTSIKSLPKAANLQILYATFKALYGIDILLPISLVFGMIATKLHLIRSNELVALYALGYDKRSVIRPIFFTSLAITILYILLHATPMTYAEEYAKNIKKYGAISSLTQNLFFKYQNNFVFFERLLPLQQEAEGVKIYELYEERLKRLMIAPKAYFKNDRWHLQNAQVVVPKANRLQIAQEQIETLQGYKPKILDSIYEGRTNISLIDAFYALRLFAKERLDLRKVKAVLLYEIFYPFFAPLVLIVIFYFVPVSARLANLNLFTFGAIIASLLFWGIYYSLIKLSFTGTLDPFLAVIGPLVPLGMLAILFYKRF
ncbi:MAG: permease [Epsilonproteobacteria bacterium]|nr:permease [Campylobacterota bacterium]NPA64032.1 YjgP/YjgQ family permease [Campylobacterota bacterium]